MRLCLRFKERYTLENKDNQDGKSIPNKKLKYILIGAGVVLVAAIAIVIYLLSSRGVAATVGSEKVTVPELKFFLRQQKDNMLQQAGITADSPEAQQFWTTKIEGEDAAVIAKRKAMESLKDLKVQVAKAKEKNVTLSKDDETNISNYIQQITGGTSGSTNAATSEKTFKDYYGVSFTEFEGIYRQFVLATKVAQKEMEGVKASEDEIKAYYDTHLADYTKSQYRQKGEEAVWARHILISTVDQSTQQPLSADKIEEARKKAEDLLAKAKNGEDFIKLVKENSQDTGSSQTGGDYIFGKGGYMMAEFEKTAFELAPGQIGLAKTQAGYHIIRVDEKIPAEKPVSYKCAKESTEYKLDQGEIVDKYPEYFIS
jgi:foldase protein PrsA